MEKKKTSYGWVIVVVFCVATFIYQYLQYQMSPIAGRIIEGYSLTEQQFASLFTAPMIPAIFLSIIFGLIVDRFGMKLTIAICMLVACIGGVCRAFSGSYATLYTFTLLTGFGATALNVTCGKIFSTWLRPAAVSIAMGCFMSAPTIGQAVAQSTTALLASVSGAFWIAGILTVLAFIAWLILGKDRKSEEGEAVIPAPTIGETAKVVFSNKNMWFVAIGLFLCLGGQVACNSLISVALMSKGMSEVSAGFTSSVISFGCLFGSLLMPMIAAKVGKNKPFLIAFAVVTILGYAFGWRLEGIPLYIVFFLTGFCASAMMPFFFAMPVQFRDVGPKYAGTATGFISTIELLGATLLPTYILVPMFSGANGVNFSGYFYVIAVVFAMILVLFLLLPETGVKAQQEYAKSK